MTYPNGAYPLSALINVEGQYFEPETARRVAWAVGEIRRRGGTITITEGYRPIGLPADQYVPSDSNGNPTGTTSTTAFLPPGSNQWFQRGRYNRGETPSAAIPGTSVHGDARAGDFQFSDAALTHEVFAQAGLVFTIASEPWHADSSGTPTFAALNVTSIDTTQKVDPMLHITRILRAGVGEFIMYVSATTVSLSPELSTKPDTRKFELGVASALRVNQGLPGDVPLLDDSPNGGWYLRNRLAAAAGMPADFPLSPTNPFHAFK